jgi:hypothetical protein
MIKNFVFPIIALLFLTGINSVSASNTDAIKFVSEKTTSQFPDGILFEVVFESASPIDEIRVFYKSENTATSSYGYMDLEPSLTAEGEFFLNTSGSGSSFVPPGTAFIYSFEVRNAAGAVMRTAEKEFIYLDQRFEWTALSKNSVSIFYYGPTKNRAEQMLQASVEAVERMADVLDVSDVRPINIMAYNNYRHMVGALPPSSQAVREGLKTEGQAFSDFRVLLVLAFGEDFLGVTSHEVTHIIVDDAADTASSIVPAWLNEGLAEFGNVAPTDGYERALLYGIYTRRIKPLWHLQRFDGEPDDIMIAYGQGKSVVGYLIDLYGTDAMANLMKELRNELSVDRALMKVYGFDQAGLDSAWRNSIGMNPIVGNEPYDEEELNTESTREPQLIEEKNLSDDEILSDDNNQSTSPSCNKSISESGSGQTDSFLLLLMLGPIGLLPIRNRTGFHRR